MGSHKTRFRPLLSIMMVCLAVSASPWGATAQTTDFSYPDKLFGGSYSFTLNSDEVMVRLTARADRTGADQLASSQGLVIVRDEGIDAHGFVVYRTAGKSATSVAATLAADPAVARAYPALFNRDGTTRYFLPDQVVVQFHTDLSENAMLDLIARLGSEVVIDHWTPGFYTVSVPDGRDVFDHVRAFINLADVQFAELSTISFNDEAFVPNDPQYPNQWAMNNTGAGPFTADADGDVEEAWDIERGNPNVIVAVIDTGVDWDHPDLQPNILQNLGEDFDNDSQTMIWDGTNWVQDPGDLNGIDDDGNGQIDDLFGWDFAFGDNDPDPHPGGFDAAHGTECSGLVAAVADNATGVAGVAHNCRLMPLRVNLNSGVNQNRADAINYAVGEAANYDAMVLSCSWICSSGSTISVQNAVVNARAADVLPVFAAGNANGAVSFPANLDAAMAIAATSPCDERKSPTSCDGETDWGSNFGNPLSLGAPGVLMATTYIGDIYVSNFNGTSSACPFTAGAVALLHSEAIELTGSALSANDAERLLEDTAEEVGGYAYPGGFSQELGNGRINVNLALQLLIAENLVEVLPDPVDLALSIDRSLSMSGDNILAAENAAAQVVRLLDIGDEIAVTSYSGGTDPGTTPDWPAWTDFPMTEIFSEADKDDAIAAIETGGDVYDLTAIGAGMEWARDELFAVDKADYPQNIILLSDGINTDGPDPLSLLPLLAPQPKVYTIGFGSYADELTLQSIATATGGDYFFAGTSGSKTGGTLSIIQTYQLALMDATERENLGWIRGQIRYQGEDWYEFVVDDSVDQALFALLWGHLDPQAFELKLADPAGNTFDTSSPEWLGDETTAAYRITGPEPGVWTAQVRREGGGGEGSGNYHLNLAGSSRVQSDLTLIAHGFGLPILAKLRLVELVHDSGLTPIRGADVIGTVTLPNGDFFDISLNDQGQYGDEIPDDGIYCATIQNTSVDGALIVETTAYGQTVGGFPFTRYDMATTVISRELEPGPVPFLLPHVVSLPGTLVELPILVDQWVDPLDIVQLDLGFIFHPEVARYVDIGERNGTMMEQWNIQVEDQGDAVILRGEGPPLQGQGLLIKLLFEVVGPLGANTPTTVVLLEARDTGGNSVPAVGHDGSIAVGSGMPDRTPVSYRLHNGWRLRSLPVVLGEEEPLQDQLPQVEEILGWDAGDYSPTSTPGAGEGFWLNYGGPDTEEILLGDPLGSYMRVLPAGWSLMGGLFDQNAVPVIEPANVVVDMFGYDPDRGYLPAEQLIPGQGTWFHASEPFTLTVDMNNDKRAPRRVPDKVLTIAEFLAVGEDLGGIPHINHVVIGGGAAAPAQVPYPPPPPIYSTLMALLDVDDLGNALYSDSRTGDAGEFWFLVLRPGGNAGGSETAISWDPDALRSIADVRWVLYDGFGVGGTVVIDDMRDVSSLSVSGPDTREFTIFAWGPTPVEDDAVPTAFALAGNYPNPFNPMTTIRYDAPRSGHVSIDVFDLRGRRVATLVDRVVPAGRHSVVWDGRDQDGAGVPSGVYFSRMTADGVRFTDRMTLLK